MSLVRISFLYILACKVKVFYHTYDFFSFFDVYEVLDTLNNFLNCFLNWCFSALIRSYKDHLFSSLIGNVPVRCFLVYIRTNYYQKGEN